MDNLTPFILAYIYQPTNPPAYKPTLSYASYVYDTETKLYYLQARYYDQDTARFISRDPDGGDKENPLSQNAYAYANADPVNNVDPDGRVVIPYLLAAAGGAVLGALAGTLAYYIDVRTGEIEGSNELLKRYTLKGSGYGIIGAVSFAGVTAGLASGALINFYDYFTTVPKSQWTYQDAAVTITSGALFGMIGGRFLPGTPIGKFITKKLRL